MSYPAIITKYVGPGNVRGSRISAKFADRPKERISIEYTDEKDALTLHREAAEKLLSKHKFFEQLSDGEYIHMDCGNGPSGSLIWVYGTAHRDTF